jgi:hypothetical protein
MLTFPRFLPYVPPFNAINVPDIRVSKVAPVSEINRFWDAFANYDGDSNAPLLWWKVMLCEYLHLATADWPRSYRPTNRSFRSFQRWHATFWPFPAPVSQSSGCFRVHAICVTSPGHR